MVYTIHLNGWTYLFTYRYEVYAVLLVIAFPGDSTLTYSPGVYVNVLGKHRCISALTYVL
jgi:hypothetical protein